VKRHHLSLRGSLIGLLAGLLTLALLNAVTAGGGVAIAQDNGTPVPTETPVPTATSSPTPLPTLQIQAQAALAPDGDLNGNGAANPGDVMLYTITVTNAGEASGPVTLAATYDRTFVSGVAEISHGGTADETAVVWNLDGIGPGETIARTYRATLKGLFPPGRTQISGGVTVRAGAVEIARAAYPAFEVVGPSLRLVEQTAELLTDVDSNGRIDPGDTVRFTITYANSGGGPSQNATLVATFPAALTREIVSNPNEGTVGEGMITWDIGSVPADGETKQVQFAVGLQPQFTPGVTTYDVTVTIMGADAKIDEQALSTKVSGPNLVSAATFQFEQDQDGDSRIDPGDTVRASVRYGNVGTDAASNVRLAVSFDATRYDVTEIDSGGAIAPEGGTAVWTTPSLAAGASSTVSFLITVRSLPSGVGGDSFTVVLTSDQTPEARSQLQLPVDAPTPTPEPTATPEPIISETRPAQGQGILGGNSVAILIGAFLFLSLLSLAFVASRVLPGTAEERAELDEAEQATYRRLVRELIEGVVLTAILFSVMVLGLQNALDQDSVNSIIAGIVGYVAGRVSSQR
jgi:uncharacterized repeat protein (TIGR01451 family)